MGVDLTNKTIETLFQQQMMMLTREANRKMRSFDVQFSQGLARC